MTWTFEEPRESFPWMRLKLTPERGGSPVIISRGLCSPQSGDGAHRETWGLVRTPRISPGSYSAEAIFLDYGKALWKERNDSLPAVDSIRVPLGQIKVSAE